VSGIIRSWCQAFSADPQKAGVIFSLSILIYLNILINNHVVHPQFIALLETCPCSMHVPEQRWQGTEFV
jgi:hypothetical protein